MHVESVGRLRLAETLDFSSMLGWCGLVVGVTKFEVLPPLSDAINDRISASVFANDFASISFCLSLPASSGFSRRGP